MAILGLKTSILLIVFVLKSFVLIYDATIFKYFRPIGYYR